MPTQSDRDFYQQRLDRLGDTLFNRIDQTNTQIADVASGLNKHIVECSKTNTKLSTELHYLRKTLYVIAAGLAVAIVGTEYGGIFIRMLTL